MQFLNFSQYCDQKKRKDAYRRRLITCVFRLLAFKLVQTVMQLSLPHNAILNKRSAKDYLKGVLNDIFFYFLLKVYVMETYFNRLSNRFLWVPTTYVLFSERNKITGVVFWSLRNRLTVRL